MDKSALVPLAQAAQYSESEIGQQMSQLTKLYHKGIPVAPTAVILRSTLEKIADQTQLAEKLRRIIDHHPKEEKNQSELLRKLQKVIKQTQLPLETLNQLTLWYNQNPGFVKVFTDQTSGPVYENIKGDINLIESILTVWAQQIQLDFKHHQLCLFAQPILLQHQGDPAASGIALTQAPENKSRLHISSVFGVFDPHHPDIQPDEFEVDVRTKQIAQQQLNHQFIKLQRRVDHLQEKTVRHYQQQNFSLDKNQILELAHLVITIKRIFLGDHLVHWFHEDAQFFINKIEPQIESTQIKTSQNKTLLIGDSLQPGMVSGTIFNLTHKSQLGQITNGQILTVHQLTPDYLPALTKAAALICDQGLSTPSLTHHLIRHSLPTIINTRHASRYLRPGLSVIVNANTGQVLITETQKNTYNQIRPTLTKVYISAGNPHKAKEYVTSEVDGVGVLRSEYIFAKIGEHPKHLIRSRKRHQLKREIQQAIISYRQTKKNLPLIYRTLDLTSNEFKALEFAGGFEPEEINPYLGFRGGIRTLSNFELLDLEVEVLQEIASQNNVPLGLMLPFVRTPIELHLIQSYLAQKHDFRLGSKIGLYLQVNTPQNILQLNQYLKSYLAGISINARSLHALIHGIDPDNPEIFSLYPYDMELMTTLLTQAAETVKNCNAHLDNPQAAIKLMLHLEDNNLRLAEIASQLGYDVITVKPEFAPRVKKRIQELEEKKLT